AAPAARGDPVRARQRPPRRGQRAPDRGTSGPRATVAVMHIDELDTPVLVADLDAVERNIAGMQAYCDDHGFALRPHIKTHKLPQLAHRQVVAGARGITCQKLGEAEVMADAGLDDIFVSFPLVGQAKAERLAALAKRVRMSVVGDSPDVVIGLAPTLAREGLE